MSKHETLSRTAAIQNLLVDLADRFPARTKEKMLLTWAESVAEYKGVTVEDVSRACKNWFQNEDFFPKSAKEFCGRIFDLKGKFRNEQNMAISIAGPCRLNTCDGTGLIEMVRPEHLPTSPTPAACPCSGLHNLPSYSAMMAGGLVLHPDYVDRLQNRDDSNFIEQQRTFNPNVLKSIPKVEF